MLSIIIPAFSVKGQTNYYSTGNLIAQVVCSPSTPVSNWQTPQKYTATFQIMKNGTVTLGNQNNLVPDGNITIIVQLTSWVINSTLSYRTDGSLMDTTNSLAGICNGTQNSWTVALPQDNQWHTIATDTCYYNPPTLNYSPSLVQTVNLQFSINCYEELVDSSPTPTPSSGLSLTFTYQGSIVGSTSAIIPVYQQVSQTPTPTDSPTQAITQSPTQAPIQNTNPTPTIPEIPSSLIVLTLLIATSLSVTVIRLKKNRTHAT